MDAGQLGNKFRGDPHVILDGVVFACGFNFSAPSGMSNLLQLPEPMVTPNLKLLKICRGGIEISHQHSKPLGLENNPISKALEQNVGCFLGCLGMGILGKAIESTNLYPMWVNKGGTCMDSGRAPNIRVPISWQGTDRAASDGSYALPPMDPTCDERCSAGAP